MIIRKTILCVVVLLCVMFNAHSWAASFDCDKASTKVEKMICADSELSKLDEDLSLVYKKALKKSLEPDVLRQQQHKWLKNRNKCIYSDCVRHEYKSRIAQFPVPVSDEVPATSRYELIKGQDVKVCKVYARYLATQKYQLRCDRDVPPQISELHKPSWKGVDVKENKMLVLRIENFLQMPRNEKATEPFNPIHREGILDTYSPPFHSRLDVDDFDINNDGVKETVARYRSFRCQAWDIAEKAPNWKGPLVVLDANGEGIDIEKTYPLMQNPHKIYVSNSDNIDRARAEYLEIFRKRKTPNYKENAKLSAELRKSIPKTKYEYSKYSPGFAVRKGYDAFMYEGKYYFDMWDEDKGSSYQTLTVFKTESGETDVICRFQYE